LIHRDVKPATVTMTSRREPPGAFKAVSATTLPAYVTGLTPMLLRADTRSRSSR
jgi:hypothetical protein